MSLPGSASETVSRLGLRINNRHRLQPRLPEESGLEPLYLRSGDPVSLADDLDSTYLAC